MRKAIIKYVIPGTSFSALIPLGAEVVHAADYGGEPTLWFLVDLEAPKVERDFAVYKTGELPVIPGRHVATIILQGKAVLHLFEKSNLVVVLGGDGASVEG